MEWRAIFYLIHKYRRFSDMQIQAFQLKTRKGYKFNAKAIIKSLKTLRMKLTISRIIIIGLF